MKLFSVIGTRPNFIKEFVMNKEFRRRGTTEIMIHTGQHYDYEMSQIFFDGFRLSHAASFSFIPVKSIS